MENSEINGSNIPVWYLSIKNGTTGLDTNYTVNADTCEILFPSSISVNNNNNNNNNIADFNNYYGYSDNLYFLLGLTASIILMITGFEILKRSKRRRWRY